MATGQLNEQEIQFRKRARRRLVGAIALVLLMVTVLPMVLDEHELKAPLPEIAISIPGQDSTGFTSKVVPVVSPPAPTAPPAAAPASPAAAKVQLSSPLEKPKAVNGKNPAFATPAVTTPSPGPAKASELASPLATEQQNSSTPVAGLGQPLPAKPRLTAAVAEPAAKSGSFSVQIGVFTDAANVKQLQAKVTAQGLQSFTETLATPKGPKIRLRAGPFTNRDAAEKAQEKLKAAGLGGIVVVNK